MITRAEWNARPPRRVFQIPVPTPKLYLHHAAGAILPGDDSVSDADLKRIRSIQNYHMDVQQWSDIAYSYLTDSDGFAFEGRRAGVAGGHTKGQNTVSHAICAMGNYQTQEPELDLLEGIAQLAAYGFAQGWWPNQFTGGHRDAPGAETSCPGDRLYAHLGTINHRITEILQGDTDMWLPLKEGQESEDVRLLKIMLNDAFNAGLDILSDAYDAPTVAAVKKHLGHLTGSEPGKEGRLVVATMMNGLLKAAYRGTPGPKGDTGPRGPIGPQGEPGLGLVPGQTITSKVT